jgi:hypothetical protein
MPARLLLYFSAAGHGLYRWQRTGLQLLQQFRSDDTGLDRFREYFKTQHGALVQIVADLDGEDFHEDQIPYLRGAERRAVIERRLAQRYRDARLAAALSLGYCTTDERRNERVLLASFNDTQLLAAWLDALEANPGVRVVGVHSTALLAASLAARLGFKGERFIFMTANRAGLRQSYVEDGQLRFSRLERVRDGGLTSALVRTDTERMLRYLDTLRALPGNGAALPVILIVPDAERSHFAKALGRGAGLSFTTMGLAEAARRVGVRRLPENALGEALYLQLAARQPSGEQFLRGSSRRSLVVWNAQRSIVGASVAGLVGCGAYAATLWLEQLAVRERIEGARLELALAREQLARVSARLPAAPTSIETLKASVNEFREIAARSALPEAALEHVSHALDESPRIELDALTWSAEPEQTLEITGRVNGVGISDHRQITDEVSRFSSRLGAGSGWRVLATRLPFDLSPEGVLAASAGTGSADSPRFSVQIARTPQ